MFLEWICIYWLSRISNTTSYFQDSSHDVISQKASNPAHVLYILYMLYNTWHIVYGTFVLADEDIHKNTVTPFLTHSGLIQNIHNSSIKQCDLSSEWASQVHRPRICFAGL